MFNDIQNLRDFRNVPLRSVGVKGVKLPLTVQVGEQMLCGVETKADFFTDLSPKRKGTHMSRILEILTQLSEKVITYNTLEAAVREALIRLDTTSGEILLAFSFFLQKTAPISKMVGYMDYHASMKVSVDEALTQRRISLQVPVMIVCPCSKAMSEKGAHNQRCIVTATFDLEGEVWIENLVHLIEGEGGAELYSVLKRTDEKFVTDLSYNSALFVEDLARNLSITLSVLPGISRLNIRCESLESIHNHSAYASFDSEHARQIEKKNSSKSQLFGLGTEESFYACR